MDAIRLCNDLSQGNVAVKLEPGPSLARTCVDGPVSSLLLLCHSAIFALEYHRLDRKRTIFGLGQAVRGSTEGGCHCEKGWEVILVDFVSTSEGSIWSRVALKRDGVRCES